MQEIIGKIKLLVPGRKGIIILVGLLVMTGVLSGSLFAYGRYYDDRVFPGIRVGDIPVGGLTKEEVVSLLNSLEDKLTGEGLVFVYPVNGEQKTTIIQPLQVYEGSSFELITDNASQDAEYLLGLGKNLSWWKQGWQAIRMHFADGDIALPSVQIEGEKLGKLLKQELGQYEIEPRQANVVVKAVAPLKFEVVSSSVGYVFDYQSALNQVRENWSRLTSAPILLTAQEVWPVVKEEDVQGLIPRLEAVFTPGNLGLSYQDPHTQQVYDWKLKVEQIQAWLEVQPTDEEKFVFGLKEKEVVAYLEEKVAPWINVPARDAKFKMGDDGRVTEFQGSRPGLKLDVPASYELINEAIQDRTWHDEGLKKTVTVLATKSEPNIKTGDVNNLGITEILGVGISDYSRSPLNRQKNIANAVKKLNGVLIKPGEEFSTLKYTAPFTLEGGYLPELVIKGDELKPEIGGGLCQIATTLFRMAMNSGMEITQRRNHALVVFHYNDPVNGNPGTDATVYDPAPDFRFRNDTNDYILVETLMDKDSEELVFTLWGTSDGRKAWYDHPQIIRWLPYGERKVVETTDLAPGEEKCQNAFRGADARFTYTKVLANGEKKEIVYESHYRPLPQICLVGVEAKEDAAGDCSNENAEECSEIVVEQADTESAEPLVENKNPA
ncbi:MAG TPA: VanW family protein [Patescibacteria group bacterium]|nr:VanW family protein [Patescibacteria group bacterium]